MMIESYVCYPFEKIRSNIPQRQKYMNTLIFTVLALIASEIPLFGAPHTERTMSEVTFQVSGTLMQVGTQPFVFASIIASFIQVETSDIVGFVLSVLMGCHWGYVNSSWIGGFQLCAVSWTLLQAEIYLKARGAISPSTALIFATASRRFLLSIFVEPVSFLWTMVLIVSIAWIDRLNVSVPLTHQKYRHQSTGMDLPVMYNSTSALIMYYTLLETVVAWYPPAIVLLPRTLVPSAVLIAAPCLYMGVYILNARLATIRQQSGKDLVEKWRKQQYTIKGWRDPKKMSNYVQTIIDRNVHWNTVFLCVLWTMGVLYRPSVGITTLFILIGTVQQHGNYFRGQ